MISGIDSRVIQVLILSVLYIHLTEASIHICDTTDSADCPSQINCAEGESCVVQCAASLGCRRKTVNCPSNHRCEIHCINSNARRQCEEMIINGATSSHLVINVSLANAHLLGNNDPNTMDNAIIYCPLLNTCRIHCDGDDLLRGTHIYAPEGFHTVHITATRYEKKWCYRAGQMYCKHDFSANCPITTDANPPFRCSRLSTDFTCNDYTLPPAQPSINPTSQSSTNPTSQPSEIPTSQPSTNPTLQPSTNPTLQPSTNPTLDPSAYPTPNPSLYPSVDPSLNPSVNPTLKPSTQPILSPSISPIIGPTSQPTKLPTTNPTALPTIHATFDPTSFPTWQPTKYPTVYPSLLPSLSPPTSMVVSTSLPTEFPHHDPTTLPTLSPPDTPYISTTMPTRTTTIRITQSTLSSMEQTALEEAPFRTPDRSPTVGWAAIAVVGAGFCIILVCILSFFRRFEDTVYKEHATSLGKECEIKYHSTDDDGYHDEEHGGEYSALHVRTPIHVPTGSDKATRWIERMNTTDNQYAQQIIERQESVEMKEMEKHRNKKQNDSKRDQLFSQHLSNFTAQQDNEEQEILNRIANEDSDSDTFHVKISKTPSQSLLDLIRSRSKSRSPSKNDKRNKFIILQSNSDHENDHSTMQTNTNESNGTHL